MNRNTRRLARGHKAGNNRVEITACHADRFAVVICGNPAHAIMGGRQYGYRLARHVDT